MRKHKREFGLGSALIKAYDMKHALEQYRGERVYLKVGSIVSGAHIRAGLAISYSRSIWKYDFTRITNAFRPGVFRVRNSILDNKIQIWGWRP